MNRTRLGPFKIDRKLKCGRIFSDVSCSIETQIEEALAEREKIFGALGTVLCPYSVWSYQRGHGRKLINNLLEAAPILHPKVDAVITMSPLTDTAMSFHLSNGADIFSTTEDTINYEYEVPDVILH